MRFLFFKNCTCRFKKNLVLNNFKNNKNYEKWHIFLLLETKVSILTKDYNNNL